MNIEQLLNIHLIPDLAAIVMQYENPWKCKFDHCLWQMNVVAANFDERSLTLILFEAVGMPSLTQNEWDDIFFNSDRFVIKHRCNALKYFWIVDWFSYQRAEINREIRKFELNNVQNECAFC